MPVSSSTGKGIYVPKRVPIIRQPRSDPHQIDADSDDEDLISNDSRNGTPSPTPTPSPVQESSVHYTQKYDFEDVIQNSPVSSWYKSSIGLWVAAGIILLTCVVVIVPTVVAVILTRNPSVTSPTTTTTTAPTGTVYFWGFDNSTSDLNGTYNGVLINSAAYTSTTYFGYGDALSLSNSLNSSVLISSPFFNFSATSFTVEAWIYVTSLTGDNAILGQCQCNSCQDQCLYLLIRSYKMYMGFTLDDLIGTTSLAVNTWYHVAFVFDYSTLKQTMYLQGVLEASRTATASYQGESGSLMFGSSALTTSSFTGSIDNLSISMYAKSATQILADATMVFYYSFDGSFLGQDMGANQMNGTISNGAAVTGRVGQGLAFSGSSYLQTYGMYQLGRSNQPFTFAMWIYPYSNAGGTLLHKAATATTGGWCQDMMGLSTRGEVCMVVNGPGPATLVGPSVSVGQWTHLGFTYSQTDGMTMYINGALYRNTGSIVWSSSTTIDYITTGYNFGGCSPSPISGGYFNGAIDEYYAFRRELSASDIYSLANP